jgi:hypothetical protein
MSHITTGLGFSSTAMEVAADIVATTGNRNVKVAHLDLAGLRSVKEFAAGLGDAVCHQPHGTLRPFSGDA